MITEEIKVPKKRTLSPEYFERIERLLKEKEARVSKPIVLEYQPLMQIEDKHVLDIAPCLPELSILVDDGNIDEIVDGTDKIEWEGRGQTFLDCLSFVGIESEQYKTTPKFSPHNRDFFLLGNMGEFTFEGETVEEFCFPTVGAEKFAKKSYGSVGVASPCGVLATGNYTDIIDAARIKLDGEEVVVYTIITRTKRVSFKWGPFDHERLDFFATPSHYELVEGELFFLSGESNCLAAKVNEWEYLSFDLIDRARSKEGIIVRMSGKEYRVPWKHSATFVCKDGYARDGTGQIKFPTSVTGLYDFEYRRNDNKWILGKERQDKVRPDGAGGIREMLDHAATLQEFIDNICIGRQHGRTPDYVTLAAIPVDRVPKLKQGRLPQVLGVRVSGGYKNPDSYRRIIMEDHGQARVNTYSVVPLRSNIVTSCGRVSIIRRHEDSLLYCLKGDLYVTNPHYGLGRALRVFLRRPCYGSMNFGGPCLRLYLLDIYKIPDVIRTNVEITQAGMAWTARKK